MYITTANTTAPNKIIGKLLSRLLTSLYNSLPVSALCNVISGVIQFSGLLINQPNNDASKNPPAMKNGIVKNQIINFDIIILYQLGEFLVCEVNKLTYD
jgi:hypothetical protein